MRSFEKRSLIRFMILYLNGILALSFILFWLYYQKETRRIESEQKIALKLYHMQCERILKNAPKGFECGIKKPDFSNRYALLTKEVVIGFILVFILSALLSFYLALISLAPMRKAIKLIDNFTISMIHDLNTPISSAMLNLKALLKSDLKDLEKKRVYRVLKSLDMIQELEDRLRDSIKDAKIDYKDRAISLCKLLSDLKERSDLISIECKSDFEIFADEIMIKRVFDNLVSNAIKYNKNKNPIKIVIDKNQVMIIDRGIGIKDSDKIFEPYYRENDQIVGLGVGLNLVKSVCEHYGIDIKIDSKVGVGTKVILSFKAFSTKI